MNVKIVARFQRVTPLISRSSSNSNRHFAVRLKNGVNSSKQTVTDGSNRNISDPPRSKRAPTPPNRALKMEVTESSGTVSFLVPVSPRASRDAIEDEHAGSLIVRLTAPPVEDRANESLRRLLAQRLAVPLSAVRIVAGEKSRTKRIAVSGLTRGKLLALLQPKNLQRPPLGEKD
jgi:uncharacterized protein (TIGR00251 family)